MTPGDLVISVVGARPHFVKMFPLLAVMRGRRTRHFILHTGQHYDERMSKVFFDQLDMPAPDVNLEIGSGTHAQQTAKVMVGVEQIVRELRPKAVVVYGDTNSTLAATIAAAKYYFTTVHVEAGVRCRNRRMPEEINRVLIDHASDYLICPSTQAVDNLRREGVTRGVMNTGDLMYDSFLAARDRALLNGGDLCRFGVEPKRFILSTIHREASTEDAESLIAVLEALGSLGEPVILPMHPRTRRTLAAVGYQPDAGSDLRIIEPVGYVDMLLLLIQARKVITDSGGVQKEAYWAGVPCLTLLNETTWTETVDAGWNILVGLDPSRLREAVRRAAPGGERADIYGTPGAARRMVEALGWE